MKDKTLPKPVIKILKDFKAELVGQFGGIKSDSTKYEDELKKATKTENNTLRKIENHRMWKSMFSKQLSSDYPKYSDEEKHYMATDPNYKKWEKSAAKVLNVEEKIRKDLIRRLKNGTATNKEKRKFANSEITIRNNKLYVDSVYSEILSGEWGYDMADRWTEKLRKKLRAKGYDAEPYNNTRWDIYKDED